MTGYERELFGYREVDTDRNGCDVRNDVLRRDLGDIVVAADTSGCVVEEGVLEDPYSGRQIVFQRGADTSAEIQVDHVVALGNAWATGAFQWSDETRRQFANDHANLLAVDGPLNAQKGDGDTATWLPPNREFRCEYVATQIAIKADPDYDLWVTAAERDAMERVLSACPSQEIPERGTAPLAPELAGATAAETPTGEEAHDEEHGGSAAADPRFNSCREAIDTGHGPYTAGRDPEYHWYVDLDGDGVACEH